VPIALARNRLHLSDSAILAGFHAKPGVAIKHHESQERIGDTE